MARNAIMLILLLILTVGPVGCKKSNEPAIPEEPAQTVEEMTEEAEAEITQENAEDELSKLEEEINADTE